MYDHTFLNLQITRSDIRPHIKWAVSLVIAYGHFNLPQGFVWVGLKNALLGVQYCSCRKPRAETQIKKINIVLEATRVVELYLMCY